MHLAIVPILLGHDERLLDVAEIATTYQCRFTRSETVIHAELTKR